MPLPQNINAIIGAGVFGIVCAATFYVVEHYRQDRRRHAMSRDLARLSSELAVLRQELDTLLAQQKQKTPKRVKRGKKAESILSTSTTATDEYSSAVDMDSSDLEFYDVSDDEHHDQLVDLDLERIDHTLDEGNIHDLVACVHHLKSLCLKHPENPELLWRLGKAHCKLFEKTDHQEHLNEGIEACTAALQLQPELANVHKWLAILVGERTQFLPMKEKILDGHAFKEHVDAAIRLNPTDASLHHMLGRFAYDVAELNWFERKAAAALFTEPPHATHEEALEHFLEAEKLSKNDWKENLLYIAKCQLKLGIMDEAVKSLEKADAVKTDNGVDEKIDSQIKELLAKHRR